MCDITPLQSFDVCGTASVDEKANSHFYLNKTCFSTPNAFAQFCIIPPSSRLSSTVTCDEQKDPNRSFLFTDILAGKIKTLHDLPVLFESLPFSSATALWLPYNQDTANRVLDWTSFCYNGFRPVPQQISTFAVDAENKNMLVFGSLQNDNVHFTLLDLDSYGLLRIQTLSGSSNAIVATGAHACSISPSGNSKLAVFEQQLLQQNQDESWSFVAALQQRIVISVLVHLDDLFVVQTSNSLELFTSNPNQHTSLQIPNTIVFVSAPFNSSKVFVCQRLTLNTAKIQAIDIHSHLVAFEWSMSTIGIPSVGYPFRSVTQGDFNFSVPWKIRAVPNFATSSFTVTLSTSSPVANVNVNSQPVITNIIGKIAWQQQDSPNLINYVFGGTKSITPNETLTCLAQRPFSTRIWGIFEDKLFYLADNLPLSQWTLSSSIYVGLDFRINDEYDGTTSDLWYMGTMSLDLVPSSSSLVIGTVLAQSTHNRFRVTIKQLVQPSDAHFANVILQLERAENFTALTTNDLQLFEDGNVVAFDNANNVLWQSNTRDRSSDSESSLRWISMLQPLVTTNGLYVLFHDMVNNTIRVSHNVFNGARFSQWCDQDPEYVSRALTAQRDFCFLNLASDDGKSFFDMRCACIAGKQLMQTVLPMSVSEEATSGQMAAVLPCILNDCGRAFSYGPEVSNVYKFVSNSCKQDVVICSEILISNTDANIGKFQIEQNCGANNNIGACRNNSECPVGMVCQNGKCVMSCSQDATCQQLLQDPFAVCDKELGQCRFSKVQGQSRWQTNLKWIGIVVVSMILLVVLVWFIVSLTTRN